MVTSLSERGAIAALAFVLYGCPIRVIADELGISVDEALHAVSRTVSMLRHPMHSTGMRDYMDDIDETITIDQDLRAFIRKHRLEERFRRCCPQCGDDLPSASSDWHAAGRPRQYCSNRCRQKAYRQRRTVASSSSAAGAAVR
ncbi:hypothetical protein [Streptomyces virginiae]|uniref:hypothetical protein n=1 Tax=Streptomyces virginiae TaxID=1961 RepID=UPI0037A77FF1